MGVGSRRGTEPLSCSLSRRWASEELDEELAPADSFRLRAHLLHCSSCRHFRRELRSFTPTLRRDSPGGPRAGIAWLRPRLVAVAAAAAVAASLAAAGTDLGGGGGGGTEPPATVRALPATEGLPVYGISPSRAASLLR
jgi:hypothetical protein